MTKIPSTTPDNGASPRQRASAPLAVVTGASTGIGFELARQCALNGFDLLIVADEPAIAEAARRLQADGVRVEALEADLATTEGVDKLLAAAGQRPIDALLANAGRGLGRASSIRISARCGASSTPTSPVQCT